MKFFFFKNAYIKNTLYILDNFTLFLKKTLKIISESFYKKSIIAKEKGF